MGDKAAERMFRDFAEWGWDQKGWSPTTRSRYRLRVVAADRWMRAKGFQSLPWAKPVQLRDYLFSTPPTAGNRNDIRAALVGFFDFCIAQDWRQDNPAAVLPRLPVPRSVPKALEKEQARALDNAVEVLGPRAVALVRLFLYGGLRHDEARTLRWRDIDEACRWVHVVNGKGGKDRVVPLADPAKDALQAWKLQRVSPEWVFPSPQYKTKPISKTLVANTVTALGEMVGIDGLHPHQLRHTLATELMEEVGDIRVVQEWLGHSSPATTAIYTKVRPARLGAAAQVFKY